MALGYCGPAYAQRAEITQEIFAADGWPVLVANPTPDGGKGRIAAWRECPPGATCDEVPVDGPDQRQIEPGEVLPGTLFEVDAVSDQGEVTTARSQAWGGRVTAVRPARLTGKLRVGRRIRPLAAGWTGGWPGDYSLLRLEACRRPNGRRCETLSAEEFTTSECAGGRAVLGPRYRGWWVRALDQRVARDTLFPGIAYARARFIPRLRPSRTVVRTKLKGPIRPARGTFQKCRW